jgi:hypothetical protein
VDIVTVMGSTIVYVPDGWDVNFDAVPVMGGVKDERRRADRSALGNDANDRPDEDDDAELKPAAKPAPAPPPVLPPAASTGPPPRLVLRGFVMMGGLVIRS